MGSPSKTLVEALTDGIAARMQLDLDGYKSEFAAQTLTSLWDQVDASGDPAVENALGEVSLGIDEHSLPENHKSALSHICNRPAYRAWAAALSTLVRSAAGGSHANLRAYLVALSAKLHPLFGELARTVLQEAAFTSSGVVLGVSNPTYGAIFPNRVYQGADGALASETSDALSAGTADVTLFASDDHTLYIGCDRVFQGIVVALSTLGSADAVCTFQYWNGAAWATLTVTDSTVGFTKNSLISFTPPADWSRSYKDASSVVLADKARLYYVRIARTANTLVTPPVGTAITLIPTVVPTAVGGTKHLGITQPPLAICVITDTNTMTVTIPASIDYTRFAHPLTAEGKLRLRALTPLTADATVTLAYKDAADVNGSAAQSAWTAPVALNTKAIALTGTDGLRSVRTTSTVSTASTEGVFVVESLEIRTPAV